MKKTLIAIAALAAALVGCTQYEGDQIATSDAIEGKSFVATIDDAETRTLLDAENKVNWEKGDCLSVFDGDDYNQKFEAKIADDQEFSKTAGMSYVGWEESYGGTGAATGAKYSIFPFAEDNAINAETKVISFTMPETVSSAVRSIANLPLVAAGEIGGDLTYKIPAALVRVKVAKENRPTKVVLKTLTLSSRENQPLSGRATVDMSAEPYKVTIAADAENVSNKVTLDFGEEGLVLTPEHQVLYFAIPETAFKVNDLMISYTGTYSASNAAINGEFKLKKAIEFKAGRVEQTSITITSASWSGSTDETPVASVNGTKFITLEDAFTEAIGLGGAQTISMLSPAVVENAITIPNGSDITLILNGNEVTSAIEGVLFTNNGKMTITDGTITAEKDLFRMENGSALTVGAGATLVSNTDAVIYAPAGAKDITINIIGAVETKTTDYAAIQTNATTEYPTGNQVNIVEGAVVKSENTVALYCPGSEINIAGGEITGYTAIYHKKGELNIAGGTLTATGADKAYQFYGNGCVETGDALVIEACEENSSYAPCVLNITGGKFVSTQENTAAIAYYKQSESAKAVEYTITGGSFSSNPAEFLAHDYRADFNGETNLFDVVSDVVVKIGEKEYTTLAKAVADAQEGATLELLGNNEEQEIIVIDKDITIDGSKASAMKNAMRLNSNSTATAAYTIYSSASRVFQITEPNVKVTLKNINIVSTYKREGTDTVRGINIHTTATEGVELTLENVNVSFDAESGTDWAYAVNVTNTKNHTIYIKGGTYEGANNINIWGDNHTVTVEGVTLNNKYVTVDLGDGTTMSGAGVNLEGANSVVTINNTTITGDRDVVLWYENNAALGQNTITVDGVRQVNGDKQLKDALNNWDVENVVINVLKDVNYTVNARGNQWGTANTKTVTINGNNNTLTLLKGDSDWDALNTYGAKIVLNDLTYTTNDNGNSAWNNYTINITAEVEMNNVIAPRAIAVSNNATLNNVTINEEKGMYAIYIRPNGQVVDINGLTVNAATNGSRGIKVIDQYMEDTQKGLTINVDDAKFNTASKAAILVTAHAATINWGEGNDISGVAADQRFAVWVDEDRADYYDAVEVNGARKWLEGDIYLAEGLILSKDEVTYRVYTAEGMAYLATLSNEGQTFKGATINLMDNIDLAAYNWAEYTIGTETNNFLGTFNGNYYTIKNFNINVTEAKEGKAHMGLFGYAKNATFTNLTFENVDIFVACLDIDHSQGHIGALAGSLEGTSTIENVTVKGDVKVEATYEANGASRVAVVAGGNSYGNVTMKNVHVIANTGSYLRANNNVGALAGQLQGKSVFENCTSNINVEGYKFFAGGIIGLAAGDQTFTNCHTTGDVSVIAGREGRANDHYRVGGIAGGWDDNTKTTCELDNCSYTGKISGKNADGSVAEFLDYRGYVGRGYTLTNMAGSKVIIDDVEFVQADNKTFGIYTVDGVYEITSVNALAWLATTVNGGKNFDKETVRLMADLDLSGIANWTPIGWDKGARFMGKFDGNNKTISNMTINERYVASDGNAKQQAALFGALAGNVEIKDLTIDNANVLYTEDSADFYGAALVATYYGNLTINNVTVKNSHIQGNNKVAGLVAHDGASSSIHIYNSHVLDSTIESTHTGDGGNVGGLMGVFQGNNTAEHIIEGCSVKNCTIKGINSSDSGKRGNGLLVGSIIAKSTEKTLVLNNNTVEGNTFVSGNKNYVSPYGDGTLVGGYREGADYVMGTVIIDGKTCVANGVMLTQMGEYELENKNALYWFADQVNVEKNEFRGETVKLMKDIALTGTEWTPIGVEAGERYSGLFYGTFDGMGNKITNMVVNQEKVAGFFGMLHSATVKNLRIGAATVNSNHYAGGICGWAESGAGGVTFDNCEVYGSKITSTVKDNDNGDKVGGIVGYAYYNTINNCRVLTNTTITGYRDLGGIAGFAKGSSITNCYVKNAIINVDNTTNYKGYKTQAEYNVGEIYGRCDDVEPNIEGTRVAETVINWGVIPPYLPGGNFGGSVEGEDINW